MNKKDTLRFIWRDLAFWAGLALLVRCAYGWWVIRTLGLQQFSDSLYLFRLAGSLAAGEGFVLGGDRIFNQSVGYPAFLSLFFRVAGSSQELLLAINIVLGVLAVAGVYVLTYCLIRQAPGTAELGETTRRGIAWVAAGVAAVYPDSLLCIAFAASENLLIPLILLLILSAVAGWRNPWLGGAWTGVVAAAVLSVKAYVIFLCPFIPLVWIAGSRQPVRRTAAAALVGMICLAPWTYINYRASGGYFVPFAAIAGEVFLDGTNPQAVGKPTNLIDLPEREKVGLNKIEQDRAKLQKAVGYIKADPWWYVRLVMKKAIYAGSPARDYQFEDGGRYRFFGRFLSRWFTTFYSLFLMLGVAAAMFRYRWLGPESRVLLFAIPAASWIQQMAFVALPHYRFPFLFCAIPFIAWGWFRIAARSARWAVTQRPVS
jgi:hypothetical protein